MCGLSGLYTLNINRPPNKAALDAFLNIFVTSQLRGFDSAGLAVFAQAVPKDANSKAVVRDFSAYRKGLIRHIDAYKGVEQAVDDKFEKIKKKGKYNIPFPRVLIGHSRAATRGAITQANAHPFSFGNNRFVGAHNGTIHNAEEVYTKLALKKEPLPDTTPPPRDLLADKATDSEIVLYCIYRYGIDAVYPEIRGAWAFVWWDERDRKLNFIRNSQRTLYYTWDVVSDTLHWSSERPMLAFAFQRELSKHSDDKIKSFETDTLYSMEFDNNHVTSATDEDAPWDSKRAFKAWVWSGHNHYSHYERSEGVTVVPFRAPKKITDADRSAAAALNMTDEEWLEYCIAYGYQGQLAGVDDDGTDVLTSDKYPRKKNGVHECVYCREEAPMGAIGTVEIKGCGYVCPSCTSDYEVVSHIMDYYPGVEDDRAWISLYINLANERDEETKVASVH